MEKSFINSLVMESFKEIIAGNKLVLTYFFTAWCETCKKMNPVFDLLKNELNGKARMVKIDMDRNRTLREQFKVRVAPTFMIFKDGEEKWRKSGTTDKETLVYKVYALLSEH
jgi:thioredoxin 1